MNREQMIEKVWIMVHDFATQFGDELAGLDGDDNEEANEDARDILDPFAEGLLDAILPQVTTVEELEALPVGSVAVDEAGQVVQVTTLPVRSAPRGYRSPNGMTVHASVIIQTVALPLTVVWQP